MTSGASWHVHKFGGTSVADATCFERVVDILGREDPERIAVVVSAMATVTDTLVRLLGEAEAQNDSWRGALSAVETRYKDAAATLLDAKACEAYEDRLTEEVSRIAEVVQAAATLKAVSGETQEFVTGFGEVWSSRLLAALLTRRGMPARLLDAREVLTVTSGRLGPAVDWPTSRAAVGKALEGVTGGPLVIPGFIARKPDGVQTTLGRNGSDFSASIFGALLRAEDITIWTDVAGILSADPRVVKEVAVIDELSYNEAMELAYFGAKVIHPQTMAPAIEQGIPIYVKSTFAPDEPGTRISASSRRDVSVKGITTIDDMALVNLEGSGMIGVPGTAHRLFGALREAGVSVVLISQASSEHSICFAVPDASATKAAEVIEEAFAPEFSRKQLQRIDIQRGCSILAVVGDRMAGMPGIAAKFFGALGSSGINVRAIAQGSSERNISAVVDGVDAKRALRAVHGGFYLSPQTMSIGLIGPGTVGSVFLEQLRGEADRLRTRANLDLRIRGIATSSRMLLDERAIDLGTWRNALAERGDPFDLEAFVDHVTGEPFPHCVMIDCTASTEVARHYAEWLSRGLHVITPNKKANSDDYAYYQLLGEAARANGRHYLYETTVGAGLPVIHTLRDLRETGDDIHRIEGIFSGTLAYLFNLYDGRTPFSTIVREAQERGYTEPDPREDLSGLDVARKVVILGREMGLPLELSDVDVEGLVPKSLKDGSVEAFLGRLDEADAAMEQRLADATKEGKVLRYVGRLDASGKASVRLEHLDASHPFRHINLTDNIVQFVTRRYADNPLIVRGPGAGPDVTAGGVFADLLRLGAYLGATL